MKTSSLLFAVLPLLTAACTTTTAYRHKDGTMTVSQRGINAASTAYWIAGAKSGQITNGSDLTVFRKFYGKSLPAMPLKCEGFIDATDAKRIDIRLLEKRSGSLSQSWANGRHELVDESAPKPFYHRLIP